MRKGKNVANFPYLFNAATICIKDINFLMMFSILLSALQPLVGIHENWGFILRTDSTSVTYCNNKKQQDFIP